MKLIDTFLSLIYPPKCAACDKLIDSDGFCSKCNEELKPINVVRCFSCGMAKNDCECDRYIYHFDGITAPFYNSGIAQQAMYNFKFRKRFGGLEEFSLQMSEYALKTFGADNIDFICFVPASSASLRKRGFNQSEVLARRISTIMKIPLRDDLLFKKDKIKTQHNLNKHQRFSNVRGAFYTNGTIKGKNILLVDDIKTTGASLDECARQLKFAGASAVYCVVALISSRNS